MPLLRLRLTGRDDDVRAITNLLQSLDGIEHVEEVDAPNEATARKVREAVEALAFDLDIVVEFEQDEG